MVWSYHWQCWGRLVNELPPYRAVARGRKGWRRAAANSFNSFGFEGVHCDSLFAAKMLQSKFCMC